MEWLYEGSTVRKTLQAAIAIQLVTLVTCYAIWVYQGCDPFMPFISDTDTNPVSGVPFTIGFSVGGLLMALLSWQVFRLRSDWIATNSGAAGPRRLGRSGCPRRRAGPQASTRASGIPTATARARP